MATSKLRVNLFSNDPALRGSGGGKCLIIPAGATWDAVLASAGAKLGFAGDGGGAKRLFTANGAEVEAVDEVMPNDVLYVSRGEDFGQPSTAATAVASPRPPPPSFPWTCAVCTYHNEAHRAACEICAADPPPMANDGSAGQPKPVSFIGQSSAPAADAVVAPMAESQAAEAEPLPLFLRRVRAPVLPGEEEEDDDERSDGEGGNDDDEWTDDEEDEDDLWCDYQEYEDYRLAMQLQAEIAKEHAAKKDEEENGLYECPICYDDKPLPQMYFIEGCFHRFCMDCIKMHLEVAIKEGSLAKKKPVEEPTDAPAANDVGIACPGNGCTNIISYNDVRHCATGILFERFESIVFSRAVDGSKDLKWCPKNGCGNAMFRSARDGKCGEEYHEAFSECSTYAEYLRETELTQEQHKGSSLSASLAFHEWARSQDLRFCPECKELIEKNMGCDHMHCTACGTDFNWSEAIMYRDVLISRGLTNRVVSSTESKVALAIVAQTRRPLFKPKRRRRKGARRAGLVKPQQHQPGIASTTLDIQYLCPSCSSSEPLLRDPPRGVLYCAKCTFHIDVSLRNGLARILPAHAQTTKQNDERKKRGR